MYFRFQQQAQILSVEDDFARLVSIADNGDQTYEFTYSVSQSQVIKYSAAKVTIEVDTQTISPQPTLPVVRGQVDTVSLVNNIRQQTINAKTAAQQQLKYQVAVRDSDISAFISNDVLSQLRARAPLSQIPSFNRPRLKLVSAGSVKKSNDAQPILHRVANSAAIPDLQSVLTGSASEVPQRLMHDMITRQGLDPSYVLQLTQRAVPEDVSHGGLSNTQQATEQTTDPASRLLNFYLFPPTSNVPPTTTEQIVDTDQVQVLQTVTTDEVTVPCLLTLPVSKLNLNGAGVTQVFVTFSIIDPNTNLPLDKVVKTVDLTQHVRVYYTPRLPPLVKASSSPASTRVNLEIKQVDPGATSVQLYKKAFWTSSTETDDYTLIGSYNLTARDQSLLVHVDQPTKSPVLYRVIPVGQESMQGFEFANVAVKPSRYTPVLAVALTATQVDTGIQLEVRHLPTNAVAVEFLRWNMTTFDDTYTVDETDVGFIDDAVRQADILTTIDTDVEPSNVYRYVARVIYRDGMYNDFGDATLEFIQPAPGQVDTSIDNLTVTHDVSPNVTFDLTTDTAAMDMDQIVQMLSNQGLTQYFQGDVQAQRDQLADLVAHRVDRVDLSTGVRESFGIITTTSFDDNALRKNTSINPLAYGHSYRYEIYPSLRAPETMFDDFVKTVTDPTTHKVYSFSPAKFLHPFTLNNGVIVTSNGVRLRTAKDPMSFGIVGSITTTEVSFDNDSAAITNATAENFDRVTNVVTWQLQGDLAQVDHFIVMKQVHGIRSIIGKVHSEFANSACQYVHTVGPHDVGSLSYVLVPIYNDYRVGPPATTNTLVVEPIT